MLRELLGDITRQNHMSVAARPVLAIQARHRGGPRAHVPVFKGVVVVFVGVMDLTGWHLGPPITAAGTRFDRSLEFKFINGTFKHAFKPWFHITCAKEI